MNIGDRKISVRSLPRKVWPFARLLFALRKTENPIDFFRFYMKRKSPTYVRMKNGPTVYLSSNPHDIITIAVVFLLKDYGSISKGAIVVDVGANIGAFSLYAAHIGARKVIAVEPNKEAFEVLCRNIRENNFEDTILPVNCAISDSSGLVRIPRSASPYNKIVQQGKIIETGDDNLDVVSSETLSNLLFANGINRVDLLKMDCEGAEFAIFPSIEDEIWERISSIRMEYHEDPGELIEISTQHNFDVVKNIRRSKTNGDLWLNNPAA